MSVELYLLNLRSNLQRDFRFSSTHKWNQYFLLLEDYLTWVVLDFSFFWIFYFFFLLKKGTIKKKGGDHIFFNSLFFL